MAAADGLGENGFANAGGDTAKARGKRENFDFSGMLPVSEGALWKGGRRGSWRARRTREEAGEKAPLPSEGEGAVEEETTAVRPHGRGRSARISPYRRAAACHVEAVGVTRLSAARGRWRTQPSRYSSPGTSLRQAVHTK